jgi:DNA-binding CsgD family transcriptional regulator
MITAERQSLLSTAFTSARGDDAFALAMARLTAAFGLTYYSLLRAPTVDNSTLADLIIASSLPASFIEAFDAGHMATMSIARIHRSVVPRIWHNRDKRPYPDMEMPTALSDLLDAYDMQMGVICPAYDGDGQHLIFNFSGNRGNLAQSEINELHMIVLQAVDAYNYVKTDGKALPHPLSTREIEVVRWTAQGKTSVEIGRILSLSDHTINAYMNNAMKKLDCVNRTQLVAKTIRLKLIS